VQLYKAFSEVPYYKIPALCRRTIPHPWTSLLLAGIPTDLGARGIQWLYEKAVTAICLRGIPMPWQLYVHTRAVMFASRLLTIISFDFIEEYITYHVQVHIFLQKVGILSPWQIPSPLFFIPFTSSSLIPAPAPPADFSAGSLLQWLGAAAINAGPFLAYALWRKTWSWLRLQVMGEIYHRLPLPEGFPEYRVRAGPSTNPVLEQSLLPTSAQQPYVSPAETEVNAEPSTIRQRESDSVTPQMPNERGLHASMQSVHAQDGTGPPRPGPGPTAIRRRSSTFSGRGDDFGSDDEDAEAIPGPLISFDVETMDAADAPPGVWFTELRPTVSSDSPSQASQQPVPLNTGLTRQPIQHASRVLGTLATSLLLAPAEAFVLRYLARSFLVHRGWPVEHMFNLSLGAWSLRWFTNYLFVDFLHLSLQTEFWSAVVSCGWVMHLTPEDWTCVSVEQQAEWA